MPVTNNTKVSAKPSQQTSKKAPVPAKKTTPPQPANSNSADRTNCFDIKPKDSSGVSSEARQGDSNSGSLGSLLSGIGEWSSSGSQPQGDARQAQAQTTQETATQAQANQGQANPGEANQGQAEPGQAARETGQTQADQAGDQTQRAQLNLGQNELLGTGRNSSPEQVRQLQEMLNAQGAQLETDGKFGPLTEQAVREYQEANGLKVDGVVGPETQGALNGGGANPADGDNQTDGANQAGEADQADGVSDTPARPGERGQISLADPNLSPAEQYEHYRSLIEANGGEINADGATVLGMRGLGTDGQRHDGASNVGGYDDTFVVLNRDANGNPTVQTFRGATHANQRSSGSSYGPDANGNNVTGVAMLAPGNYSVDPFQRNYQGYRGPSFHVKTQDGNGYVPAYRDRNADGRISDAERAQAEAGGYQASGILFHAGRDNAPSSIGCQTMPPEVMRAFSDAVGFDGFNFTLLDANNSYVPA